MTAKKDNPRPERRYNIICADLDVAKLLDLNCGAVYHMLRFWIETNETKNQNYHDGRYWTYNSVREWCELIPYLTEKQIWGALDRLEKAGLIVTGNYNKMPYDRTKWYSINPTPQSMLHFTARENGFYDKGETIPVINTNSNTMIKDDEEEERNENFNSSIQKQNQEIAKVFKSYESEIGVLTSLIGNEIKAYLEQDNVSPDWIVAAIEEASRNNKRSWSYISAIIKRWQVEGFQSSNKPESKPKGKGKVQSARQNGATPDDCAEDDDWEGFDGDVPF